MPRAALIGVDWGTTSLRAFLLGADGSVLDRREGPRGILTVADGDFAAVLATEIGGWLEAGKLPVLLSGMIGSRQGWIEAPYLDLPAGTADFAAALVKAPFDAEVRIIAGAKTYAGAMPDVLRGEEVQVLGAMARLGIDEGRFVLPGTHSKWVEAQGGRLTGFATYMTGEIYSALRNHTILARLMQADGEPGGDAFEAGVWDGAKEGPPGALLHRLFGVRTAGLFERFPANQLAEYLSGLLIGAEMADRRDRDAGPAYIVASDRLAERYRTAAASLGFAAETAPADCVAHGHVAIARQAGMI